MKILFVDDEPNVLHGLQRMLRKLANEWSMSFVAGGHEALAVLAKEPFDVVVSDVRMPVMDGVQLLTQVQERHPDVVRIILSGHAGEDSMLRAVGPAHQCLSKPCDSDKIQATVKRAVALRNALTNEKVRRVVSSMKRLPSLPDLYQQVMKELRGADPSLANIGKIVAQDMAMSAKVLQVVNSSFFGLANEVADPARAVVHLGMDTVRALVLQGGVFEQIEPAARALIGGLWDHSTRIACLARRLALADRAPKDLCDSAFQAGFLHDIGRLVVAANLPAVAQQLAQCAAHEAPHCLSVERELLGVTHAEIGGYLLGIWGLPNLVVEAVMFHHGDALPHGDGFPILAALQFTEALESVGATSGAPVAAVLTDHPHLAALGDRLDTWWQTIRTMLPKESQR